MIRTSNGLGIKKKGQRQYNMLSVQLVTTLFGSLPFISDMKILHLLMGGIVLSLYKGSQTMSRGNMITVHMPTLE